MTYQRERESPPSAVPSRSSGLVLAIPRADRPTRSRLLRALIVTGAIAFFAAALLVDGLLCWRDPRNAMS